MTTRIKQYIAITLTVLLFAGYAPPLPPQAALAVTDSATNLTYETEYGFATITDASGETVTIPEYVEDSSTRYLVTRVVLSGKSIGKLDVSACTALEYLDCSGSGVTEIIFGENVALEYLDCSKNQLTGRLNVGGLSRLIWLDCSGNTLNLLTVFDSEMNIRPERIARINASDNKLSAINVGGCKQLEWLDCSINKLIKVDVSGLTKLRRLNIRRNSSLDYSKVVTPDQKVYLEAHAYNCTPQGGDACQELHGFFYGDRPVFFEFVDLSSDAWYADAVKYVLNNGIMAGDGDSLTFRPEAAMTRAEFVQVLYALEGKPGIAATSIFTDVPSGAWYVKAVSWAVAFGITAGVAQDRFAPEDYVTREQAVVFLYKYAKLKGDNANYTSVTLTFSDKTSISDWAMLAVKWSVSKGVIKGYNDGSFQPKSNIKRCEVAQVLKSYLVK
ncbi:MAG: S-layer homology domain-containing protein [Oscillospiraceae bacterium]|jgi:hypothetical protein|nr:S-layer homology domain-containing protein [Oscillospiraceae bacterium]